MVAYHMVPACCRLRRLAILATLVLTIVNGAEVNAQALPTGRNWIDALDPRAAPFDATPNDGEDDREALQRWIDAGCGSSSRLLYLPPGDWHVSRRLGHGVTTIGSLKVTCDGLTIIGAGRASRIVMKGTAVLATYLLGPADWSVFEIAANAVTIEGIAIDGSQRTNTGEQTHLIQIKGPARDTELRRLYFNLPALATPQGSVNCRPRRNDPEFETRRCDVPGRVNVLCKDLGDEPRCSLSGGVFTVLGWFRGGDCIRSVGEVGAPVDGIGVMDSYATACDRSFISVQRASHNLTITNNVTRKVTDQIIDLEPTGTGGIGRVIIMGNRLERGGASAQGAAAIALEGNGPGAEMAESIIVSGNFLDGGIITTNVARVSIEHNIINGQPAANDTPVIQINNRTDSLRLIGNEIDRPAESGAGPVLRLRARGAGRPADITIALNTLRQNTNGHVITMAGAQNITIVDNTIHCGQLTDDGFAAIKGETNAAPIEQLIVSQNRAAAAVSR
jgi:hypothetical protein